MLGAPSTVRAWCPTSPQRYRILKLLSEGRTYAEIALALGISPSTVRSHCHALYRELGVAGHDEAVSEAYRRGWIGTADGVVATESTDVTRLAAATEELLARLDCRSSLTITQHRYLDAFDALLRSRTDDELEMAQRRMSGALRSVLGEAGVEPSGRNRGSNALAQMLTAIARDVGRGPRRLGYQVQ